MAVNKNFVVKNGLEVGTNLIYADAISNKVSIGTTEINEKFRVDGDIGGNNLYISGISSSTSLIVRGVGNFGGVLSGNDSVQSGSASINGYKLDPGVDSAEISVQGKNSSSTSNPFFRGWHGTTNIFRADYNGNVTITGKYISPEIETTDITVSGISILNGNVDINSNLDVDGRTELDIANISETLNVVGFTTLSNATVGILTAIEFHGDGSNLTNISNSGSGIVGIDTTAFSYFNHINAVGIITAQDFDALSDIRYKSNIKTINNVLNKVVEIRGVSFDWKETQKPSYGLIAQELEEIFPELVRGEDPKVVNYNGIIPILIESIKEMKSELDDIKKIILDLKNE